MVDIGINSLCSASTKIYEYENQGKSIINSDPFDGCHHGHCGLHLYEPDGNR